MSVFSIHGAIAQNFDIIKILFATRINATAVMT